MESSRVRLHVKTQVNEFNIEIQHLSNYNAMKLKINYKKKYRKVINKRLKNMLQNNCWVNEEIKEK